MPETKKQMVERSNSMKVIDRIEENIIVAYEEDVKIEIPADLFEGTPKESDVITADETTGIYRTDKELTEKRKEEIAERYRKFKEKLK
jgi:hypothetical protein